MTLLRVDGASSSNATEAERLARRNGEANRAALTRIQAGLAERLKNDQRVQWMFARDGCLSAIDEEGKWIGKCSVPRRAAEALAKDMHIRGAVGCFLNPNHAAQVRVVLEKMERQQGLVVLV